MNIGVLASGRGSNLLALLEHERRGRFKNAHIVCTIADVAGAKALDIAREHGIAAHEILPKQFGGKTPYEAEVVRVLESHNVEFVCLAGYMRIVGPTLLTRFSQRMLNIHPSLLPSFPGLEAQRQAVDYGVRMSGCTVHLVDAGMDTGPIVAQRAVPVLPSDTPDSLAARILEQEHELYAEALALVTECTWHLQGRRVIFNAPPATEASR
jgi:phosphoribosylglycinamide formyltransferase 1